jgi:hypothetical protein
MPENMSHSRVIMQVIITRLFLFSVLSPFFGIAERKIDSTMIYHSKYTDRVIVSLYQSERSFNLGIQGFDGLEDSVLPVQYRSDARRASGIALDWDKISLSFDYKLDIPDSTRSRRFGKSEYFNFIFGFSFRKILVETSFRKFQGFYDMNSPSYLQGFKSDTSAFYQNSDLTLARHNFKFLWFSNKDRFSPKAPFNGIYRQKKSAAAWALVSNVAFSRMSSAGNLIPQPLSNQYADTRQVDGLRAFHLNFGGGGSVTLVILKGLFFNFSIWGGPDMQLLSVADIYGIGRFKPNISFFAETRSSLGLNLRNFFVLISSFNDATYFRFAQKLISPSFLSAAFEIGYRFPSFKGRRIDKLKENKWYRML